MKFKMILIYVFFKCITDCHDLSLESIKKRHLKSKSDTLIKNTEINDINDQIENTIKPKGEIEDFIIKMIWELINQNHFSEMTLFIFKRNSYLMMI